MKNVIAIFGVPRTGTSWLGEIFNSSPDIIYKFQPLFSYAFKDYINVNSSKEEMIDFFGKLKLKEDEFLDRSDMRKDGLYPYFEKKNGSILAFKEVRYLYMIPHLLETFQNVKVVMILRDAIDTINSWINAPKEFRKEWDINKEWYFAQSKNLYRPENYYGYAKWKEAWMLFREMEKIYPHNAIITRYEDLYNDSLRETKRLFEFCDLELDKQTLGFLRESQQQTVTDSYGVFRKKGEERTHQLYISDDIKNEIRKDLEITQKYIDNIIFSA